MRHHLDQLCRRQRRSRDNGIRIVPLCIRVGNSSEFDGFFIAKFHQTVVANGFRSRRIFDNLGRRHGRTGLRGAQGNNRPAGSNVFKLMSFFRFWQFYLAEHRNIRHGLLYLVLHIKPCTDEQHYPKQDETRNNHQRHGIAAARL